MKQDNKSAYAVILRNGRMIKELVIFATSKNDANSESLQKAAELGKGWQVAKVTFEG